MTHVHRELENRDGLPTGGVYGALNQLFGVVLSGKCSPIIFCVDRGVPAFRKRLVPEYKQGRKEQRKKNKDSEAFYQAYLHQIALFVSSVAKPFGIHVAIADGFEADDVIGSLCVRWWSFEKLIFSNDRDVRQLIGPTCTVYDAGKGAIISEVSETYLLERAMIGDSSDNIPGVPFIGPARAEAIINSGFRWHGGKKFTVDLGNPYQKRAFEGAEIIQRNVQVMDLRETAKSCGEKLSFVLGDYSSKAIRALFKELAFRNFAMQGDAFLGPFKRAAEGSRFVER